jgi:hypothetical protein
MVNLHNLNLRPNQKLSELDYNSMLDLFAEFWKEITTYKGMYENEQRAVKGVAMVCSRAHGNYPNVTLNDICIAIEKSMAYDDVSKLSPEYFLRLIQKVNNEKIINEHEHVKSDRKFITDTDWGKALGIRLNHDPGGIIMDEQGFTLKDIFESVKKGFNIYTGNAL